MSSASRRQKATQLVWSGGIARSVIAWRRPDRGTASSAASAY